MASKRTLQERIQEKNERYEQVMAKAKQYEAQKKQLEKRQKEEDRKIRTRRLIQIGGAAESVLGREFTDDDILRFMNFLKLQEKNGGYFTRAMSKPLPSEAGQGTGSDPQAPVLLPEPEVGSTPQAPAVSAERDVGFTPQAPAASADDGGDSAEVS